MLARGAGSQFPVEPGEDANPRIFSVRTRSVHVLLHCNISNLFTVSILKIYPTLFFYCTV